MDKSACFFYNPRLFGAARHSEIVDNARIAQLVEQGIENPCVAGSIPAPGTTSWISYVQRNPMNCSAAHAGSRKRHGKTRLN